MDIENRQLSLDKEYKRYYTTYVDPELPLFDSPPHDYHHVQQSTRYEMPMWKKIAINLCCICMVAGIIIGMGFVIQYIDDIISWAERM